MYSNKKDAYFIRGYQVNPSSLAQASEMMLADKHDIPALLINLQWHSEVLHQSSQCSQASRGVSRGLNPHLLTMTAMTTASPPPCSKDGGAVKQARLSLRSRFTLWFEVEEWRLNPVIPTVDSFAKSDVELNANHTLSIRLTLHGNLLGGDQFSHSVAKPY